MNIEYQIIPPTEINLITLEQIRYNAYNISHETPKLENTFYTNELKKKKYLIYGCFLNHQLIGACYISNSHHSLYIEQLFILKKYQRTKFHFGKKLLEYILTQKDFIQEYFQETFHYSILDSTPNATALYKSLGYKQKNNLMRKYLP